MAAGQPLTLPPRSTARAPFELLVAEMQRNFLPNSFQQNNASISGGERTAAGEKDRRLSRQGGALGLGKETRLEPFGAALTVEKKSGGGPSFSSSSTSGSSTSGGSMSGSKQQPGGEGGGQGTSASSGADAGAGGMEEQFGADNNDDKKLELMGFDVGRRLCERVARTRASTSAHPFLATNLDCVKFLCRELWECFFGKQVENLKTNRRGTFVLTDQRLLWLRHLPPASASSAVSSSSSSANSGEPESKGGATDASAGDGSKDGPGKEKKDGSDMYTDALVFPCGLIRGALSALGLETTVSVNVRSGVSPLCFYSLSLSPLCFLHRFSSKLLLC